MPSSQRDKSYKRSISLPESAIKAAKNRASELHDGNLSRYIHHLIQSDIAHTPPDPEAEDPLEQLMRSYAPALAEDVRAWCEENGYGQRRFLAKLLFHIASAAEERHISPAEFLREIELIDPDKVATYTEAIERRQQLKVAEPPENYPGHPKKKSRHRKTGTG